MDCHEALKLIHAYVDGELDLVNSLEVEQHVQTCPECSVAYRNLTVLRAALKDDALYAQAPATLQKRVLASVQHKEQTQTPLHVAPLRWPGLVAALVAAIILTFGLTRLLFTPSATDLLAQEVIASHVRAELTNHLADVASSDQHTVKPWFNGKLDFSPTVVDLASQGFPLIGGRLDYLDNRPVAALVYRRQQHPINLFIWPSTGALDESVQLETRQGYNLAHWTKAGMTYWATSDLNNTEFQQFVRLVQAGT